VVKTNSPQPAPVQSFSSPQAPIVRIALDYCGPFPETPEGNKYLLVIIDHFSRFVRLFPVGEATSLNSVRCLRTFIGEEGLPKEILTDQGTHFIGQSFRDFLQDHGIKHLRTSAAHPQCDGMAERQMRTVKNLIRADLLERMDITSTTWDRSISKIQMLMNQTIHPATGLAPWTIVRGRTPRVVKFPWLSECIMDGVTQFMWYHGEKLKKDHKQV
jgi:transposase InsO family protein